MENNEIHAWLIRISHGDQAAFAQLYEETKSHSYKLIRYLALNKNDVPDIMNEVYMQLLKSTTTYNANYPFSSWFNGLIVRQVRSWNRKSWRLNRVVEKVKLMTVKHHVVKEYQTIGDQLELEHLLSMLSQKYREIIVLRYFEEYSLEEIAELLDVPVGTVKSRHHYALKKLRKQYEHIQSTEEGKYYVIRETSKRSI